MLFFIVQGLTEEVILRGYLLGQLMRKFGAWPAILVTAVIFANLHGSNPGSSVISYLTLSLFGTFTGYLFVKTGNIWIVAGFHSTWNFLMGPVLGVEVSGQSVPTIFTTTPLEGQEFINGGAFGFEGGIVASVVFAVALAALLLTSGLRRPAAAMELESSRE